LAISIRRLRLVGVSRNYDVPFIGAGSSTPNALSIIAGEISTGKTSVLEFIDYCLGASSYPKHQEIERNVRSALLEVDLGGDVCVIERALSSERVAYIHHTSLADIDEPHAKTRRALDPPGDPASLSNYLLETVGLAGITLQQAPSQIASKGDPLSFRNLMWLSFMPNNRLDGKQLLREVNPHEARKMRQVIEVVFEVHDDQLAKLAEVVKEGEERRAALVREIRSLELFLEEQDVPERMEIKGRLAELEAESRRLDRRLRDLTNTMQAQTDYAKSLRADYAAQAAEARTLSARVRDRDTLLKRLLPLRAQYAEEESQLVFYDEAKRLFDPLRVEICPSCLQHLPEKPHIDGGTCSLCGQRLAEEGEDVIDVQAELRAIRDRLRELNSYIEQVEMELAEAEREYASASAREQELQARLDVEVASALAPFVAERDQVVRELEAADAARREARRQLGWHEGLEGRRVEVARLDERLQRTRDQIRALEASRPSRDELIASLSARFASILTTFGFPKLNDPEPPYIDANFVPHVRGNPYRDIGSTGGLTLISLAWILTIFEHAIDGGFAHPGFLLLDSPQKNLTPVESGAPTDEFRDPAIVQRVWEHIMRWSEENAGRAQLIVVDNRPPEFARPAIVREYSGRRDQPPYGLIEDEIA
jgi:hypothetical protein